MPTDNGNPCKFVQSVPSVCLFPVALITNLEEIISLYLIENKSVQAVKKNESKNSF